MASPFELEVTISSAKDLKNVNWRHGDLKPYAVVWVDPTSKFSIKVDQDGDTCPVWNETLVIPLYSPIEDSTLSIDIIHAYAAEDVKPLIGSARIPISEIVNDVGIGEWAERSLKLKRPSGRPHGKLNVNILVRRPRYRAPDPYYAPPYGVPPPATSRDYQSAHSSYPYQNQNPNPSPYASAPSGYPYNPPGGYPQGTYGAGQGGYPQETGQGYGSVQGGYPQGTGQGYGSGPGPEYSAVQQEKKNKKLGMGTGLAIGAVAGVLGGLVLAEGVEHVEHKIADDAAEKVEEDSAYDDGGYGGYG
ncbi:hypothetical protein IFM89_014062 [Coptis chinensis]|uniref:C2 domain-containing protein n=1 Tax=Coptis chinensis TaxID=261450 RepID=A0A835HHT8_9MAGN|nr:hypothetical protein IFM89_014062 [Coptis chinensis]